MSAKEKPEEPLVTAETEAEITEAKPNMKVVPAGMATSAGSGYAMPVIIRGR